MWAAGCLWGINGNGCKEIWGLVIFIAVGKARLSTQCLGGWHWALHSVRALPIRSEPFSPLFWSTWSALLQTGKQIRSLTFPMTLTQIPVSIDQQSAYLNGTCPIPFLTMPHPFQSGRNRIENQSSDIKKDFFFNSRILLGPLCLPNLRKLSYFILILIFSNVDSSNTL